MKLRKLLSIFIIAIVLMKTFSANAQNNNVTLEPLEVKAMRTAIPEKRIPFSVTIITRKDIEKRQVRTVADALKGALGVNVSPSGGMGATTSVFMRGNESNATMVIIDGARVNIGSTGLFDFGHLTTDNIEKIEILRGSQSTLWGQDAMGGVINIITRKGKGTPTHSLSFEGGSYGTYKESISSSGTVNKYSEDRNLRISIFDSNQNFIVTQKTSVNEDRTFIHEIQLNKKFSNGDFLVKSQYGTKKTTVEITSFTISESTSNNSEIEIPEWVKNNAGWWANDEIDDASFVSGIEFLISDGIIVIK